MPSSSSATLAPHLAYPDALKGAILAKSEGFRTRRQTLTQETL
jgi:hypothetical protein